MTASPALLTCPLCGQSQKPVTLAPGDKALCFRCDALLAQGPRLGRDTVLLFSLTGLILAGPALFLPFITAGKFGQERGGLLFTGVEGLWDHGMRLLSIWVLLCGVIAPIALLAILTSLQLPAHLKRPQKAGLFLTRAAHAVAYWAMPEVQVLAVLVALMKLGAVVNVTIGAGFWFYSGMSSAVLLAWRSFTLSPPAILAEKRPVQIATAKRRRPIYLRLRSIKLSNTAAFSIAALVMLVPANFLPVLTTNTSGVARTDTIFSGIVELWRRDLAVIAIIVFLASIVIPILKLVGLGWLIFKARRDACPEARELTRLYAALDFIGRWSMLDVFLVAFLSGVVQFGAFSTVQPRAGIVAFAIAVVLTVLATHAFDPRVLWRDQSTPVSPVSNS